MFNVSRVLAMLRPSPMLSVYKPSVKDGDAIFKVGRRLAPQSAGHLGGGQHRQKVWQYRFMEVGDTYDRVWLALGGKMKRRRIGRPKAIKDLRYYWRPIEQHSQRTYMARLRLRFRDRRDKVPMGLHASDEEIGHLNATPLKQFVPPAQRYSGSSPPKRKDFEFRVF